MLFIKIIHFMLWFLCLHFKCYGISTREAKSFYDARSDSYLMTNDFAPIFVKKDNFKDMKMGKGSELDSNQIPWISGEKQITSTESSPDKNFWLTEFGETDKIITVRVSSSVAKSNQVLQPSLQRIGFGVEVPVAKASTTYDYQYSSEPIWVKQTTENPAGRKNEGRYYETRIESVSSRREVVFGKSKSVTTTTPQYEHFGDSHQEFGEIPEMNYELSEKNYEVDEAVSLMTNGDNGSTVPMDKSKLGYVMEGRNFRKYRVEERTPDGFIVGEYGFIRNEDGKLHGVRYTADINANPRLIYDALVKFLSL